VSKRTDAIRKVLDLIDANPGVLHDEVEPKYSFDCKTAQVDFSGDSLNIHLPSAYDDEGRTAQKELVKKVIRAFGGTWDKEPSGTTMYFMRGNIFGHLHATIYASRDAVCERVVTGTKLVEHARVEAVKAYTETVEEVEWVCMPLLAERELVSA
jgi:hypothetical protein